MLAARCIKIELLESRREAAAIKGRSRRAKPVLKYLIGFPFPTTLPRNRLYVSVEVDCPVMNIPAQPDQPARQGLTPGLVACLFAWAAAGYGALAISWAPGNWGHWICGPWGCGPPLQALLGCHLAWLVGLTPVAWLAGASPRISEAKKRRLARGVLYVAAGLIVATIVTQCITWRPAAADYQRRYLLARIGFVMATTVDIPMWQLLVAGLVVHRQSARTEQLAE